MKPSVIEPVRPAIEHTKRVLFDPFDFVYFLQQFGPDWQVIPSTPPKPI